MGGIEYLTPLGKAQAMFEWYKRLLTVDDTEAPGTPDVGILFDVARLNALDGVVVLQSCKGHPEDDPKCDGTPDMGTLWLRVSEGRTPAMERVAVRLSRKSWCERPTRFYEPWGDKRRPVEVWQLRFKSGFAATVVNAVEDGLADSARRRKWCCGAATTTRAAYRIRGAGSYGTSGTAAR